MHNKTWMPTFLSPLNHPATPPIYAVASHRRCAKKMNRFTTITYWTGLLAIWCFASLYLAAMSFAPGGGLQITTMLGFKAGSEVALLYGWIYTGSLIGTAISALASRNFPMIRCLTMLLAGVVLGLTALPLVHSILHDYSPARYENYVGESLTILSTMLLFSGISLHGRQTKAQQAMALNRP